MKWTILLGSILAAGMLMKTATFAQEQVNPRPDGSAATGQSAREAIAAANKIFEAAHLKGDAAALAEQYTEDAQILWEDRAIISGRKKIEAEWARDMNGPGRKANLTTLEVEQHGDWAYETGKMLITAPDGKVIYDGKYICIWKREKGQWKIHRDIGNKNLPAAPAP